MGRPCSSRKENSSMMNMLKVTKGRESSVSSGSWVLNLKVLDCTISNYSTVTRHMGVGNLSPLAGDVAKGTHIWANWLRHRLHRVQAAKKVIRLDIWVHQPRRKEHNKIWSSGVPTGNGELANSDSEFPWFDKISPLVSKISGNDGKASISFL